MVRGFALLLMCLVARVAMAQGVLPEKPYILPYTMTTLLGPHAAFPTTGLPVSCGAGTTAVAFTPSGDGCPANLFDVSVDPHDIRVDGFGDVFYSDNSIYGSSDTPIHRYDPRTGITTIYASGGGGSTPGGTICSGNVGNGCFASDNLGSLPTDTAINSATGLPYLPGGHYLGYTGIWGQRGLDVQANGDLYVAGYNSGTTYRVNYLTDTAVILSGNGSTKTDTGDGGPATKATDNQPRGIAGMDRQGNIWIAETGANAIREILANGIIETVGGSGFNGTIDVAGCTAGAAGTVTNGFTTTTLFDAPEDIKFDTFGNIYAGNQSGNEIMALYQGTGTLLNNQGALTVGTWYVVAGVPSGTSGCATPSSFGAPTVGNVRAGNIFTISSNMRKFSLDSHNNLYLGDGGNQVVWFMDHITGYARLIAGTKGLTTGGTCTGGGGPAVAGDGCPATQATFAYANGQVTADSFGNIFIGDEETAGNSRIREVINGLNFIAPLPTSTSPASDTLIPTAYPVGTTATQTIDVHVNPVSCTTAEPPVCIPEGGTLPYPNLPANTGATFTITGSPDFTITNTAVASTTGASPAGIPVNADGTIDYLVTVQFAPSRPGQDTATLTATTFSGLVSKFSLTGTGGAASIAIDPGSVAAAAPNGSTGFHTPAGAFADAAGNFYIADSFKDVVFEYNALTNTTTVVAGNGTAGNNSGGVATASATLNSPSAVTADGAGNLYIADTGNNRIDRVDAATGILTVYAGGATLAATPGALCPGGAGFANDALGNGCPATAAQLSAPSGVAIDKLGNLFIADTGHNTIRRVNTPIDNPGYILNFAGGGTVVCATAVDPLGDGCTQSGNTSTYPTGLNFNGPTGLALDNSYNLYVADTGNNAIRKINTGSTLSTLLIGTSSSTTVKSPSGVAVDAAGNVYVADTGNSVVRMIASATGAVTTIAGINGAPGAGTLPLATVAQLGTTAAGGVTGPLGVAVGFGTNGVGELLITDPGNTRVLVDSRTNPSYNFGSIADGTPASSLPPFTFTETNTGTTAFGAYTGASANLGSPIFNTAAGTNGFTVTGCTSSGTVGVILAPGASCTLTPTYAASTGAAPQTTFQETAATNVVPNNPTSLLPSVTLNGTGLAATTSTTTTFTQTSLPNPPSFGLPLTLQATVAGTGTPTGTVVFSIATAGVQTTLSVTGTLTAGVTSVSINGLLVGAHTITAYYSGDATHAPSASVAAVFTVTPPATTTTLTVNGAATPVSTPQFNTTTYTATVTTDPIGIALPQGTVTFINNTNPASPVILGTGALSGSGNTATATFTQQIGQSSNGVTASQLSSNTTLVPGTYKVAAIYNCISPFSATNDVTLPSCSILTSVSVTNLGSGYTSAPTVTFSAPAGGGVTATGTANLGSGTGAVTGLTFAAGSFGYTTAPTLTFSAPPASPGATTATGTATVSGGVITSVTITNPGAGYLVAPTVTVTGVGSGGSVTASVAAPFGALSGITITNVGTNYTSAPTVTIGAPNVTGGAQAVAAATVQSAANPGFLPSSSLDTPTTGAGAFTLTVQPQTVISGTNSAIFLTSKGCNASVIEIGTNGLFFSNAGVPTPTPITPSFACPNDIAGSTITTGVVFSLANPAPVVVSGSGTASGPITQFTLCPITLPLSSPQLTSCSGTTLLTQSNYLVGVTFTEPNTFVAGQVVTLSSVTNTAFLSLNGTYTILQATSSTWTAVLNSYVSTAQGASVDSTIFILPSNTLTGTLTFSCSGLPANSACTFNPTQMTLTASPNEFGGAGQTFTVNGVTFGSATEVGGYPFIPLVVTIFTDLQPGQGNANSTSLRAPGIPGHTSGISLALLLGWPVTLLGLAGLIRFRKRKGLASSFTLTALLVMALGSSVLFSGCGSGGPGPTVPNLTPTGLYPVTVTVTNGTATSSIVLNLSVSAGLPGSE